MDATTQQQEPAQAQQPDAAGNPAGAPPSKAADAYRRIVTGAMQAVYGKGSSDGLLNMIRSAEDPVIGVAQATVTVLNGLKQQIKGINPNFVYTAASAVAGMLFELGDAAGLFKFDPKMMQAAMRVMPQALQQVGESGDGPTSAQPAQASPAAPQGAPQGLISSAMGA